MNKMTKIIRTLNHIFGFLAIAAFIYAFIVLIRLQPKMVAFEPLSALESALLTGVGFGLLIVLAFFLLSLLQVIRFIKHSDKLRFFPILLVISGVLSLLFVFSDVALLTDISKQFNEGWAQPEWAMVFPMLAFQFVIALLYLFLHVSGYFSKMQVDSVVRDVNIFLIVQYVGLISGGMGLAMGGLGFVYQSGWSLPVHTILSSLTIIFPYALAVLYWIITKLREKDRVWWDEKQMQDIGKSALVTLLINTILMLVLFIFTIQDLAGVVRMLWLPLYLFLTVFMFSLGNLYFSRRG